MQREVSKVRKVLKTGNTYPRLSLSVRNGLFSPSVSLQSFNVASVLTYESWTYHGKSYLLLLGLGEFRPLALGMG